MIIVTINDVRKAGYCTAGARRWFALHRLDFRDFLVNGLSDSVALETGDAFARAVVARAKERLGDG